MQAKRFNRHCSRLALQLRRQHWTMPWRRDLFRVTCALALALPLSFASTVALGQEVADEDLDAIEEEVNEEGGLIEEQETDTKFDIEYRQEQGRDAEEWYEFEQPDDEARRETESELLGDDSTRDDADPYRADVVDTPDTSYYDPVYDEAIPADDYAFGYEYDDELYDDYYTDDWYDDSSAFDQWYQD